jgi:hypothetical protein
MRRIALFLTLMTLGGLAIAPVASAQYGGAVPMNQTGTGLTFSPGSESLDPTGSVLISSAVIEGMVHGSPINGSIRLEEVRTRVADAGSGSVQGQFTLTDHFGNTLHGDLSGNFTMGPGSTSASGQMVVRGGTGPFTNASGTGSFSENVGEIGASSITLSAPSISMMGIPGSESFGAYPPNFNGIVPAPAYVQPAYVQPAYVQPVPAYYGPANNIDPYYGAYQREAAASAAAAQAAPQIIIIPESEIDPNGVFSNPPRSATTNRNYR